MRSCPIQEHERVNQVARSPLSILLACLCAGLLACADSRDLDALGVRVPDGGLDERPTDDAGNAGGAGTSSLGSGTGNSGRAGTGSVAPSGAGNGGRAGSGSGFPIGSAGSGSGFPFPGGGNAPGGGNTPGGGNNPNVSACAPCEGVMGVLGDVPACCTSADECGVDLSGLGGPAECQPRDQPGRQTGQCPSIDSQGTMIPGCCRPNGECGIIIMRTAPLGCIDPDVIANVIQIDPGPTQRCNP
jgi:hypothetical protein